MNTDRTSDPEGTEKGRQMTVLTLISDTLLLLFLAVQAREDLKKGSIPVILPCVQAVLGLTLALWPGGISFFTAAAGTIAGFFLLVLAYASHQAIGYGDGLMTAAAGLYLGLRQTLLLLLCSLLLSAVCAMILMAAGILKKKDKLAFAPFLLAGYVLLLGICRV